MSRKIILLSFLLLTLVLAGCYEGRGYAYEHLNSQDPGALQREDPARAEVDADDVALGGTYEHLNNNLCGIQPECCGKFTSDQKWYHDLQERAIVEKNTEICANLPVEPLVVDCSGKAPYDYYNRATCYDEAR